MTDHPIDNKEAATKLDVYSFSILMWELFFRKSPYHHVKNTFKIPQLVCDGERPQIPFSVGNQEEIREWLLESNGESNSDVVIQCIDRYFSLVVKCWNHNPLERPLFSNIRQELEEILSSINH